MLKEILKLMHSKLKKKIKVVLILNQPKLIAIELFMLKIIKLMKF